MRFDRTARKTAWLDARSRQSNLILAGFLLVLAAASIVVFGQLQKETGGKLEMSVYTDKDLYRSGEAMNLSVSLPENLENATIKIRGIMDSGGRYRIEQDYSMSSDERSLNFTFMMPSCYGCAGISPGDYEILAEVFSGEVKVANCTKTVSLDK